MIHKTCTIENIIIPWGRVEAQQSPSKFKCWHKYIKYSREELHAAPGPNSDSRPIAATAQVSCTRAHDTTYPYSLSFSFDLEPFGLISMYPIKRGNSLISLRILPLLIASQVAEQSVCTVTIATLGATLHLHCTEKRHMNNNTRVIATAHSCTTPSIGMILCFRATCCALYCC